MLNEEQDAATLKKEAEARHRAECVAMNTWQDIVDNWKHEMEQYASVSWSEIVEREITHYRKPGDIAQMHEKLLSPSRKRF
ncbi:unnamed protein product [Anisakis simplex]|uniref:CopG family transcriptional regulator n=1 Tax=Anisakis simplex TaxID=6269 RepID=A0A0M3JBF8_ANISI|nr:unnamed protein product [Anisakis simplex]